MLVLVFVGAGTGNADDCAVPDTLVPFAEGALVPAGVLVAMPIVVGPRVAPPMPAPVPALEVVAVALAADIASHRWRRVSRLAAVLVLLEPPSAVLTVAAPSAAAADVPPREISGDGLAEFNLFKHSLLKI